MERFKAYEGNKPFVFVSYAHFDRDAVYPIISTLNNDGYRIWYDEGIEIAAPYKAVINEHIEKCNIFAVFVTKTGILRPEVIDECTYAIALRKKIIFICLEEVESTQLPAALRATFAIKQQLLWYKWTEAERARKLRDAIVSCKNVTDNHIKANAAIEPSKIAAVDSVTSNIVAKTKERHWCYLVSFACAVITLLLQPTIFQLNRLFSLSMYDFYKLQLYFFSGLILSIAGLIISRIPIKRCSNKVRKICRFAFIINWIVLCFALFVYFALSSIFVIYNDI